MIFVKKIMLFLATTVLVAAIAVPAALANGDESEPPAPPAKVYCLDGNTTSLPAPVTYVGGSRDLREGLADFIIGHSGGVFFVGFFPIFDQALILVPDSPGERPADDDDPTNGEGWLEHFIARGACTSGAIASIDRLFFVCTGDTEPTVMSRNEARDGVKNKGWFWPFAVPASSGLGKTNVGDWTLTCRLPAGWVQGDLAVSTGGGESYGGAYGASLLADPNLAGDYVPNYHL